MFIPVIFNELKLKSFLTDTLESSENLKHQLSDWAYIRSPLRVCDRTDLWIPPSFRFPRAGVDSDNLHFWQVPDAFFASRPQPLKLFLFLFFYPFSSPKLEPDQITPSLSLSLQSLMENLQEILYRSFPLIGLQGKTSISIPSLKKNQKIYF